MSKVVRFVSQFDAKVGTDREITKTNSGSGFVVCFELENCDVKTCRDIENSL